MERNPSNSFEDQNASPSGTPGSDLNRSARSFDDASGILGDETVDSTSAGFREQGSEVFEQGTGKAQRGISQAREKASHLRDQAREKAGQAREKATELKATLADKLEAGASRIRQRTAGGVGTELSTTGVGGARTDEAATRVGSAVASGMQSTADWLRTADVNSMKTGIEQQVKTNPGRTLLVALGLGYVLGRVFRGQGGPGTHGGR